MERVTVQAEDLFLYQVNQHEVLEQDEEIDAEIEKELQELGLSSDSDSDSETVSPIPSPTPQVIKKPIQLPSFACTYCTVHDPLCVAKCNSCSKWFCNGNKHTIASHIVNHLVKSGHKEVSLHPESPVGDAVLECYNCGCKNIFLLGYVQSKKDSVVVLLCRQPCAFNSPKDMDWDIESWAPLISDRSLLPWLVQEPTEDHFSIARKLDPSQIEKLETLWKSGNPYATLDDVGKRDQEDILDPTKLVYDDVHDFKRTMMPLILAEAKLEKELKEKQKLTNLTIRWDVGLNTRNIAWFPRPDSEVDLKITAGDEVILRHSNPSNRLNKEWTAVGTIISIPHNLAAEIPIEIKAGYRCYTETSIGYSVEFVWNSISFDRMHMALNTLTNDPRCMDSPIFDYIIGTGHTYQDRSEPTSAIKNISVANLPELNHSQAHAVRCALTRPLTLIQGPPGTGKTVTSASIVYHLAQKGPVLVVASSNIAVDHLTEKIHQSGLRVVRIVAKARESIESSVGFLALNVQARSVLANSELDRLYKLKNEIGQLSAADEKKFLVLQRKAEGIVLDSAQVVCCTCVGAGDPRIKSRNFASVLIDEATQATEPEALIPLVHGAKQVIMVGDHRQLGPVLMNKACVKAGFDRSMFERLMQVGVRPIRLQVQYRMHPSLSEFPSNAFYDGSLQNGVSVAERVRPGLDFEWPNPHVPMFLLSCFGTEEIASSGTSFLNRVEANNVEKIISKLLKLSIQPSQIGVITPYQGQRAYILQTMMMAGSMSREIYEGIEVASVDAFQGREKDYIILSCVRSNDVSGIGFVADTRRMNVALTRARYGLIVLGNPRVLSKSNLWNNLICHFKELNVLMEGTMGNLRPSTLQFSRSTYRNRSPEDKTESALNLNKASAYDPYDDDNVSLHSYATGLYYNDNLSQLSQADFDAITSDEELYLSSSESESTN